MPPLITNLKKILLLSCSLFAAFVPQSADAADKFYDYAKKEMARTKSLFEADKANSTNAWHFARACFDLAEIATNAAERADVARIGIAASKQLLAREPKSAAGHYALALNYGELADAEAPSLTAYKLVHEIEHEFTLAAEIDPHFDYAGPARCLGLLYRDAPGWPLSIGNKHKSREWLDRAAALAPDYPENQINIAESHLRWHQPNEAATALKKLNDVWPSAQTNLTGATWGKSWSDWKKQRSAATASLDKQLGRMR